MKTLILYATKHGAAREIARRIAARVPEGVICDLKQKDLPSLSQFDCVVVGSSLCAGAIRREAKGFLSKQEEALRGKRLGLFLSGLDAGREEKYFSANFSPAVLESAVVKRFLGGIYDPEKAGGAERFIMKHIAKQAGYKDSIDDDGIERFAKMLTD